MEFKFEFSKQVIKFLQKQDLSTRKRIYKAIYRLPEGDIKKLQNRSGYRLRVGDFRVIYDKYGNIIEISKSITEDKFIRR